MKIMTLGALLILALSACGVDDERVGRALRAEGYTDYVLHGYALVNDCPEDMEFNQEYTARRETPQGPVRVDGIVCCNLWGTCTVRTR